MIYTIKHAEWHWLIEQDKDSRRYKVKYKKPTAWAYLSESFESAEMAADAIAKGKTGLSDWDALKHPAPVPSLGSWLIDPTDGPGGSIVPTPTTT